MSYPWSWSLEILRLSAVECAFCLAASVVRDCTGHELEPRLIQAIAMQYLRAMARCINPDQISGGARGLPIGPGGNPVSRSCLERTVDLVANAGQGRHLVPKSRLFSRSRSGNPGPFPFLPALRNPVDRHHVRGRRGGKQVGGLTVFRSADPVVSRAHARECTASW